MRALAAEERANLNLGSFAPLNPYDLAAEHGIPVYGICELVENGCTTEAIEHFTRRQVGKWSAALVPQGTGRFIIENTAHSPRRRRSSVAHELSHQLLEHEFDSVLLADDGSCRFDKEKEGQARFLSGQLLIPDQAAVRAAFRGTTNYQLAARYGVSPDFAQWRMSGARVVADRATRKQARAEGTRGFAQHSCIYPSTAGRPNGPPPVTSEEGQRLAPW
jgi:hypothetical protein